MWEVLILDRDGSEIGTFDYDKSAIHLGSKIYGDGSYPFEILKVELNPSTGEDAAIVIEFL